MANAELYIFKKQWDVQWGFVI